jgi:UDP-glucose 4-epimerase
MNILVTGGAGYVGSHAARLLDRSGHDVWIYDNCWRGHRAAALPGRLVEGQLAERDKLCQLLTDKKIDGVMHFAAVALVGESVANPALYYENNVVGTLHLLEAMRAAGVRKIVFSSTTAVYGVPQRMPITEDETKEPINPYGFTKLTVEQAREAYREAYDFGSVALRYFNAAGASPEGDLGEDHDPETHLIPIVLDVALGKRPKISLFGDDYPTPDGTCIRDYVHVDDLGAAHVTAIEQLQPGDGLQINLGTGRGTSVREVIDACRQVTGHPIPAEVGPRRPGDPPELVADSRRAAKKLNWQPRYASISEIIATAWQWHRQHPHGYDDK